MTSVFQRQHNMIDSLKDTYTLEGSKVFKRMILVLAGLILLASLVYVTLLKVAVLIPIFVSGVFLVTIQFHRMTITRDKLIVEKTGLVKWLSMMDVYQLMEIESIQYSKGTPMSHVIVNQTILRSYGHGPRSKADKLILNLKNGEKKFINRMGRKHDFLSLCEVLDQKLSSYSLEKRGT